MRRSQLARKLGALAAGMAFVAALFGQPTPASAGDPAARPAPGRGIVPVLPPSVVAMAERARGTVVRRRDGATVVEIRLPASLRPAHPEVPATVWRVRVAGSFPPRALRYEVLAGGRPVGYGTPSADEQALIAVTANSAVTTDRITTRYGQAGRLRGPGRRAPSAHPSARRSGRTSGAAARGPFKVTRAVYNLGDQVFQPSGITGKVELAADVHYPTGLPGGPYPLILFLHGNHDSCYRGSRTAYEWPCRSGWQPMPNYIGYDYIAEKLAGWGFIVVSVSGNGIDVLGNQLSDTGMRQRGELLEKHLALWHQWSTTGGGPFGSLFVGKVDFSRIGVMGHSRGGEGAIWQVIVDRGRTTPYGIDAVLALAPVDFTRTTVNNVPMAVMLPYCDGDVSNLAGMHFFDDARYRVAGDPTPKDTVTVMGANHNFFNTVWSPSGGYPGSSDDGLRRCPARLSETQQRKVGWVYVVDFFRRYIAGTLSLDPVWTGAKTPRSIAPAHTLVTYLAPDEPDRRLDVDRFTASNSLSQDQLVGSVATHGLSVSDWCAETFRDPCVPGPDENDDVHLTGLSQGVLGWGNFTGSIRFDIPAGAGDVQEFDALQFRVAVNPAYAANNGVAVQNLVVELMDSTGGQADVAASTVDDAALAYPPGLPAGHVILNQVRFPLSAFFGVDLQNVTEVSLLFTATKKGAVDISDMAFMRGAR